MLLLQIWNWEYKLQKRLIMTIVVSQQSSSEGEIVLRNALALIGDNKIYQKRIIVILGFIWVVNTYSVMINSFIFMNPVFQCQGLGMVQTQNLACQTSGECVILNDYTGTYQARLYCDRKNLRSIAQGVYPMGCLIGFLVFSILSDVKGRKFSYLLSCFIGIIGTYMLYAGIYSNIFIFMVLGQLGNGIFSAAASSLSYIISGQIGSSIFRQRSIMIYCAIWGATQLTFIYIENSFNSWKDYLLYLIILPLIGLFISSYFYFVETPSFYLINKKDSKKCKLSLSQMGKMNGSSKSSIDEAMKLIDEFTNKKTGLQIKKEATLSQTVHKLFFNPHNLKSIVCLSLIAMGFNTFYYGLLSSLERTGYSFGFNVFLVGLHQFIGYSAIGYFVTKIKRKSALFVVNTLVSILGLSFALPIVSENASIQSFIVSLCTLGFVTTYSFTQMLNMESFTAQIRSTAVGISSTFSQVGRFFIPFILTAMNDIGVNPLIAVSALFAIMAIPPLFIIKQTFVSKKSDKPKNKNIANTFQKTD